MNPQRRSFEELEAILGKDWTKQESTITSGVFVNFERSWPCGCEWHESLGNVQGSRERMELLGPCQTHADLGFLAQFRDDVWRDQSAMYDKTRKRKGKRVTAEMLTALVPGQVLRIRPNNCTHNGNATAAERMHGAWLFFVVEPLFGPGPQIESYSHGPISTIGNLTPEALEQNEVLLVSRGDETWPKDPVWVVSQLEIIRPKG